MTRITPGMEAITKIRYKDKGSLSNLYPEGQGVRVRFYENAKSIAPVKALFFTKGTMLLEGELFNKEHLPLDHGPQTTDHTVAFSLPGFVIFVC